MTKELVRVCVIKHLPQGLSVELDNGRRGVIRKREISWKSGDLSSWKETYPVGWKGLAVPISSQKGQAIELSLRLAENDPWDNFVKNIDRRKVFDGIVVGVATYGAFIEIGAGLTGLLHRSQIPVWAKGAPLDLFWPGDKVRVLIREVDYEQRHIKLGLPPVSQPEDVSFVLSKMPKQQPSSKEINSTLDAFFKVGAPKRRILVVEDEPEQRIVISNWLQRVGQRVDTVESAEQALDFLRKHQPDLALVDVGLPQMDGITLAEIILEKWPQIHVISTTDWARADEMSEKIESLQMRGAELLIKPILPDDLIPLLQKTDEKGLPGLETTLPKISDLKKDDRILDLLRKCRTLLGYDLTILFALDPTKRTVYVVEQSQGEGVNDNLLQSLIFSPVRDVAEDRKSIAIGEISFSERERFRYLLDLFPAMSCCIGVPIPAQTPLHYALFILDKNPHQIKPEQSIYVEAIALALGALLEQESFQEKSFLIQRAALIGQLTRSFVHEINNIIAPLSSRLENFQTRLSQLDKGSPSPDLEEKKKSLVTNELFEFQSNIRKIINTTRMFGRIVAKEKLEVLRIDKVIEETLYLVRDAGNRSRVTILFKPPEKLLIIRNLGAALEQVLLNVLLNAIQQIAEIRPESGGWIKVQIEPPSVSGEMLRILVEDNGPGIHVSLWEKIFDIGFTSRHDGSGIGLFISRSLIEKQMRGKIYVQESRVLGGTTFAMEIPGQF
ncbi:MAG: response regulator [Nitrospirae bacterium]|nr:response regulator [Nitrospirota bacterium]